MFLPFLVKKFHFSQNTLLFFFTDVSIPVVCIVVEGGPNTIATVHEAIMNQTPAVIVAGSGRAANILAFAFQRAPEVEMKFKDKDGNIITQYVFNFK